jgi:transketolase
MATGSEVQYAVKAAKELALDGVKTRVVSLPCLEWFEAQPPAYKDQVLPPDVKARVSVEAGIAMPWYKYLGDAGIAISVETYGASASQSELYQKFAINADSVRMTLLNSIENAKI